MKRNSPAAYHFGNTKIDPENDGVVPVEIGGRTLAPVRFIAEQFGATVGWEEETETVTIRKGMNEIKMEIGKAEMTVDGKIIALDAAPTLLSERTCVLRAIAKALGKSVFWDDRGLIVIGYDQVMNTTDGAVEEILALLN